MNSPSPENLKGHSNLSSVAFLVLILLVVAFGLTLANYRFAAANPGGNDFIPRWLGTRLLLNQGQNPYSEETSLAIQEFMYDRPAQSDEDQVLFVYPLYSAIIFSPYALIGDYFWARALWMTTLEIALLTMAFIGLRLAKWKPSLPVMTLVMLFVLIWYHSARPLINGNASILVALFIVSALYAIRTRHDTAAGVLLAMSTIKPQAIVLFLPLILMWAYSRTRYRIATSTLVCLGVLFLLAALFEPTWLWQNVNQVVSYPSYTLAGTPGAIFAAWWPTLGRWLGLVVTALLAGLLLWQWKLAWKRDFEVLLPVAYFTLAATNLIGITTAASNYIALVPGLLLLLAAWRRGRGALRDWPAVLAMITLLIGLWFLFWTSRSGRAQSPIMLFPLPLILIIGLPFLSRAASQHLENN
jgi:hypothetical protein